MGCEQSVDISIDPEKTTEKRTVDPTETADLDVYVSTLSSPVASGLVVTKELGLVSGTCVKVKGRGNLNPMKAEDVQKWALENSFESEGAKLMAIGKLRTKAKQAGANAVLGMKVDMESEEWPNTSRSMTTATATGTACILADTNALVLASEGKCLYVSTYV
mmetsp:Transcript_28463/g.66100  ORF Transcript_28463/g.66100 Transcript_28463/m.66100 type:complete len:162 (-) Transcript_28463:202-687(-)